MASRFGLRRGLRMKSELEQVVYEEINNLFRDLRIMSGNPLQWFCDNRVPIGYKTLTRRFAYGDWALDEMEAIQRELRSARVQEILNKRLAA